MGVLIRTKPPRKLVPRYVKAINRLRSLQAMAETNYISGSVISRAESASILGYQYGTSRDLYEALGYPTSIELRDYLARYERQDIAKAVIDRPVKSTWSGGLNVIEANDDKETDFEKQWKELDKRLFLVDKFARVDKMCGLGQYSVLLLGFDDISNKNGLAKPVRPSMSRELLYVKPLFQRSADVHTWENDPSNERYGQPLTYKITLKEPGDNRESITVLVHHTRVIHVSDDLNESEVKGTPKLEPIWNRLMDLEKIMGGSAEMFWRGGRPGYALSVKNDGAFSRDDLEDLEDQIDEYENNLRRMLAFENMDVNPLAMQVADPANHVDIQIQAISAISGIPKRILVGSERGELASSEDRSNWLEIVKSRREGFAEPRIIYPFVDRLVFAGVLSTPSTESGYSTKWKDLFSPSDEDKAKIGDTISRALNQYVGSAAYTVFPFRAYLEFVLKYDDQQIATIMEMVKEEGLEELRDEEDFNNARDEVDESEEETGEERKAS